jgi:hypothetical protein
VFPDSGSFNDRMDREARARLKAMGIEDPEAVKTILAEHASMKADAEKKRQESMSELEREKEARAKAERERDAANAAAASAQNNATLGTICAEEGIRNVDYARFVVDQARAKAPDPAKFDPREVLTKLKADASGAAALGIASAVPGVPATTTTPGKDQPPPAGNPPPSVKPVKDMSPQEFREHVEKTTGYTPR